MIIVCHCEQCPSYKNLDKPMKMVQEHASYYEFLCQTCWNGRVITKARVGGTMGAGAPDDGRRTVVGRGWMPSVPHPLCDVDKALRK